MNQTYYFHKCEFIHTSQHFFMEKDLCELFANMMVTSWYIILDYFTSKRAHQLNT
jgi:CxC5 like cysteine cluster associated with KDZ transposases